MMQWISVAIILALCVLYICRRLIKRHKSGNNPCCGCGQSNCPNRKK